MVCLDRLMQRVMSDWSHLSVNIVCLLAQKNTSLQILSSIFVLNTFKVLHFWLVFVGMPVDHTQIPGHVLMCSMRRQF